MMGIDAVTFDPPVWAMFEREQFWEAHRVMWEEDYWHLENLCTWISYPLTASSCPCCPSSGLGPRELRFVRWRFSTNESHLGEAIRADEPG